MSQANSVRQIILDTETTGMNQGAGPVHLGHKVIEIGAVEVIDRKLTGRHYHQYINPQQKIDEEAMQVHGITDERVAGEPLFAQISQAFIDFIDGAEIIAHNAPFDISFLDNELAHSNPQWGKIEQHCKITDSLDIAKTRFPGQKNNLDALCKRFGIDNSHRTLHGALLDAEILADVYLLMTGGQLSMSLATQIGSNSSGTVQGINFERPNPKVIYANADELAAHNEKLDLLDKKGRCIWREVI